MLIEGLPLEPIHSTKGGRTSFVCVACQRTVPLESNDRVPRARARVHVRVSVNNGVKFTRWIKQVVDCRSPVPEAMPRRLSAYVGKRVVRLWLAVLLVPSAKEVEHLRFLRST